MKTKLQMLLIGLTTAGFIACGGSVDDDVEVDEGPECGEGTILDEDEGLCVLDLEELDCADGEIYLESHHRCARVAQDYCAEGTWLDEGTGRCVAEAGLECADNTVEEDDECLVAEVIECGDGTVLHDGQCNPFDEVCAEGTDGNPPQEQCRPEEDICGANTVFDVGARVCIPVSTVTCGPGTEEIDGACYPTQTFYDDLADDPDIDVTGVDGPHSFDLPEAGERFVFVGNVDAPQEVDGEFIQHKDVFQFSGDAGQWINITLYSLGVPEPGFYLTGANDFYRLSDVGVGVEVSRDIVLPADGTFELNVSNLAQLTGSLGPAGGEDWGYVGYVEILDAPDAVEVDLLDDTVAGNITHLQDNLYQVDGLGNLDEVLLVLDAAPSEAEGELQIWSDLNTLDEVRSLSGSSTSFTPPSNSFYILFDYAHAFGPDVYYAVQGVEAVSLDDGDSLSEEVSLSAGDYVGLSQFNTEDAHLSASISDGGDLLASTNSLVISTSDSGQTSLYYLADQDMTVTVAIENDTGADIDAISYSVITGEADKISIDDTGGLQEFAHSGSLLRGHRHYFLANVAFDGLITIAIDQTSVAGDIVILDEAGDIVLQGTDEIVDVIAPGEYVIYVEAHGTMGGGFTLTTQESGIFDVYQSSSPSLVIIDGGGPVSDTISIASCPEILDIEVSVDIEHWYIGDLIIDIIHPDGSVANIHNNTGFSNADIVATYPYPGDPNLDDGAGLLNFVGESGAGDWVIEITDTFDDFDFYPQYLHYWSVSLECQG